MFKQNVGSIDRVLRIVVGLVLIALVFVGPKTPWGWIGLIPLAGTELRSPVSVIDRLLLLETTVFVLVVSENIPNVFKELSEQRER